MKTTQQRRGTHGGLRARGHLTQGGEGVAHAGWETDRWTGVAGGQGLDGTGQMKSFDLILVALGAIGRYWVANDMTKFVF